MNKLLYILLVLMLSSSASALTVLDLANYYTSDETHEIFVPYNGSINDTDLGVHSLYANEIFENGIALSDTYLELGGGNANQNIDISPYDLTTGSQITVDGGTGASNLLIIADSDNVNENDVATLSLDQDGGLISGSLGFLSSNDLVLDHTGVGGAWGTGFARNGVIQLGTDGDGNSYTTGDLDVATDLNVDGTATIDGAVSINPSGVAGSNYLYVKGTQFPVFTAESQTSTSTGASSAFRLYRNNGVGGDNAGTGYIYSLNNGVGSLQNYVGLYGYSIDASAGTGGFRMGIARAGNVGYAPQLFSTDGMVLQDGTDTALNWASVSNENEILTLLEDDRKLIIGESRDSGIWYNGSDMLLNPQLLGDGDLVLTDGNFVFNEAIIGDGSQLTGINRTIDEVLLEGNNAQGQSILNLTNVEIINDLQLKNGNNLSSSEVTFESYSTYGLRVQNSQGYISMTPLNTGWAHMSTDRPRFIFNKDVVAYNGIFSSYSTNNLTLRAGHTSGNDIFIQNNNAYVGLSTTTPSERLDVNGNAKADLFIGDIEANGITLNNSVISDWSEVNFSTNPSGDTGQVQFNDNGEFGSDGNFVFNDTDKSLTVGEYGVSGGLEVNGLVWGGTRYPVLSFDEKGNFKAGLNPYVNPNYYGQTAMGFYSSSPYEVKADGYGATTIGGQALGFFSTAIGSKSIANGSSAFALGVSAYAGASALAIGDSSQSVGSNTIAIGIGSGASGINSEAIGRGAIASGDYSLAIGNIITASGYKSVAIGSTGNSVNNSVKIGATSQQFLQVSDKGVRISAESGESITMDGDDLYVKGNQETDGFLVLGANTESGLSAGDINASTIYYDTLVAKSPTFQCSENKNWCEVGIPEYQTSLYLRYDPLTWNVQEIMFSGQSYEPLEFYNGLCQTNAQTLDICNQIADKIIKLSTTKQLDNLKTSCTERDGTYINDGCYQTQRVPTTYSNAVESFQVEIKDVEKYTCQELNNKLEVIDNTCYKSVSTGILETKYRFKADCGWDSDYYCNQEVLI